MDAWLLLAAWRLRRSRRSAAVTAVLAGLAVGVVLAGLAGARRVDASLPSFLRWSSGADAFVFFVPRQGGGQASDDLAAEAATIRSLPGVGAVRRFTNAVVTGHDPALAGGAGWRVLSWTAIDRGAAAAIGRPRLVAGRMPVEDRAGEIAIDEELARDARLHVGSPFTVQAFAGDQLAVAGDTEAVPAGATVDARVVGVVRLPLDLRDLRAPPGVQNIYLSHYNLYLTPAFWRLSAGDVASYNPAVAVTLRQGSAGVAAFAAAVGQAFDDPSVGVASRADFLAGSGTLVGVDRSVSIQSRALQLFALAAALAALLLVGQTLGRQLQSHAGDDRTLLGLGMSPAGLGIATLAQAGAVSLAGASIGVAVAIGLSPLAPLPGSTARLAELDPGIHADWAVLAPGALAAALVLALAAALPVLLRRRSAGEAAGRPSVVSSLTAAGLPVPVVVGARFALEPGRGRTAVPVRSAAVACIAAVAFVAAAIVFASSLSSLRTTPSRYGVTWDLSAGAISAPDDAAARGERLAAVPGVEQFSGLNTNGVTIAGHEILAAFIRPDHGWVGPRIVRGRVPADGEIALGKATMAKLHVRLGDAVEVVAAGGTSPGRFTVIGQAVLNAAGIDRAMSPGEGALLDWSAIDRLLPADLAAEAAPQSFLVRLSPGADRARVRSAVARLFPGSTSTAIEPDSVANLGDVAALPVALAGVVALIGLGTVAHAMVSAVRRRRHDVAVLKCLGLVGSQLRATVACQALTFGLLAVVFGLPLGVAAGRTAWSVAVSQLAVVDRPVVPTLPLAAATVGFVAVVLAASAIPGNVVRRVAPAVVLRRD